MTPAPPMTLALRCSVCKTHEHLHGSTANAYATGPLDAEGGFADLEDFSADDGPELSSVECTRHLGAGLDVKTGGVWCRWRACLNPSCRDGEVYREVPGYRAERIGCVICLGAGGRYVPVSTIDEPPTAVDVACHTCHVGLGTPCQAAPRYGETAAPTEPHPERLDTLTSYLRERRRAMTAR